MKFAQRSPSTGWEPVGLSATGQPVVWGWFKPVHAPSTVAFNVPLPVWSQPEQAACITIRRLTEAAGLDALQGWTVFGQNYACDQQTLAYLDLPLPAPPAGVEPLIVLWSPMVAVPPAMPAMLPAGAGGYLPASAAASSVSANAAALFDQMQYHWSGIQQIETELRRARMQLEQAASRLSSLNRDLSADEANSADNNDKKDWQDARRWLRDGAAGLTRSIKEIDVGVVSGAGQRHRFEDLMKTYVQPRVTFPGMEQSAIDFEMFHKSAKNVLNAAQTALSKGGADAERRANAVLQRISIKARARRSKHRSGG